MEKLSAKTAQTKADLVNAFWQLYKEKPINKITVKDVTDTAGYYRSTLYYYFEDVYAILEYIEDSVIDDWEENIAAALRHTPTILMNVDVQTIMNLIMPFYLKNGEYIAVLLSFNGDPLFAQKFKAALWKKLSDTFDIPQNAQETALVFEGISSGTLALFVKWYNDKLPTELVINIIQKFLDKNILGILLSYSNDPMLKRISEKM